MLILASDEKSIKTCISECEIHQQSMYERKSIKMPMNTTPTTTKSLGIVSKNLENGGF